jgi:hypothetical protein
MNDDAEQEKPSRVIPGVLTLLGAVGIVPLWEPLVSVFEGIGKSHPRALLNLFGLSAFALWTAVVSAALVTSLRARQADPAFRGIYSELVRTSAVLLTVLALTTWITIDMTGAIERPYDDDCVPIEDELKVEVLRCRFRL